MPEPRFRVGSCVVEPEGGTLTHADGRTVRIRPKVMELLVFFTEHRGEVLSKDALLDGVWRQATLSESALTRTIAELRQALGDDAERPTLLETIPKRGYRFIGAVGDAGDVPSAAAQQHSGASAVAVAVPPPAAPARGSWRLPGLGLGLAAATLFAIAVVARPIETTNPEPQWVLVTAFENHTDDARLGESLRVALEQVLLQSREFSIVPRERIDDTLRLMRQPVGRRLDAATARELALRDGGIALIATGTIATVGSRFHLDIRLLDAGTGAVAASSSANAAGATDLLSSIEALAAQLRRPDMKAHAGMAGQQLARVTTTSLPALHAYSEGYGLLNQFNWAAAELRFREAVDLDPDFATAWVMLGHAIRNQFRQRHEYMPAFDRAFELSRELPARERYFIAGTWYGHQDDDVRSTAAFEALVREHPNDFWGVNNLVVAYARQHRRAEVAALSERRAALRPHDFVTQVGSAERIVITSGNFARATPLVDRARSLEAAVTAPPSLSAYHAWLRHYPAFVHWAGGRIEDTAAALQQVAPPYGNIDNHHAATGLLELTLGRVRRAEAAFDRMSLDSPRQALLAYAALARGDRPAAERALRADRSLFDASPKPSGAGAYGWTTLIFATLIRAGFVDEAEAYVTRAGTGDAEYWAGMLAIAREQVDRAQTLLHRFVSRNEPGLPPTLIAFDALAETYQREGQFATAVAILQPLRELRAVAYPAVGSRGYEWLRTQARLARAMRQAGDLTGADALERELRDLLRAADADLVLIP